MNEPRKEDFIKVIPENTKYLFDLLSEEMLEVIFGSPKCVEILVVLSCKLATYDYLSRLYQSMRKTNQPYTQNLVIELKNQQLFLTREIQTLSRLWRSAIAEANKLTAEDKKRKKLMKEASRVVSDFLDKSPEIEI